MGAGGKVVSAVGQLMGLVSRGGGGMGCRRGVGVGLFGWSVSKPGQ